MKRSILASLSVLALTSLVSAQQPTLCGTDLERARLIAQDPTYLEREAAFQQELRELIMASRVQRDDDQVYRIPVVFHVLHLRGKENITNEQIYNAVSILNRDYDAANADSSQIVPAFQELFADMDVEFRLATIDPIGHCTNGIVRHQSVETFQGGETSKLTPWPRNRYLNIWVTRQIGSGAAGYFSYGSWSVLDGIMILQDYVGGTGSGFTGSDFTSRALTHEVGHYLSLAHVWGSNNGVPEGAPECHMQATCGDDAVEDTPFTRGWSCCTAINDNTHPWGNCDRQLFHTANGPDDTVANLTYTFNNVSDASGTQDPTPVPNVLDSAGASAIRVFMSAPHATGVSANSSVWNMFGFTDWGTGAADGEVDYANLTGNIDLGKYYEFMMSPDLSQQLVVSSFSFDAARNNNGTRTFAVRSSANNYTQNLPISGTGISVQSGNIAFVSADAPDAIRVTVDPPALGFTNVTTPVGFRIYAWNAEDGSGSFIVDSLTIVGNSATIENVQNYMEYSYCSRMFTDGQRERARSALNSPTYQRNNLWTTSNLQSTGTAEGFQQVCPPEADFYAQVGTNPAEPAIPFPPMSCDNTTVRFYDNSARADVESWSWTFQDGNPATSSVRNPTVQFTGGGWKTVSLTVTNAQGSSSKTDPYAVYIGTPEVAATPYFESFEDMEGTNFYPYVGFNYDNNHTGFFRYEGGGATGNACVMLNSGDRNQLDLIDPDNAGDFDDFVTPLLNLTGASSGTLSFRYAYSTTTADIANVTERLEVESSFDCGRTWQTRGSLTGTALLTNGNNNSLPPAEWKLKTYTLPGSLLSNDVRFRFRFISSAYSGHFFIDDIWIGVPVGMQDLISEGFITLYPNPTTGSFTLQVTGMESTSTEVSITDMRGAVVYQNKFQPNGGTPIEIDGRSLGLAEGLYMVRASNNLGSSVQKLVIGK